nr:TIGR04551 family protein [Deltaproteobacteria bacterium]
GGGRGDGDSDGDGDGGSDRGSSGPILTPPVVSRDLALPMGADLAALGAELTPRRYAAPRDTVQLVVHGGFRLREQVLFNLDLDRGLDARGQPVFPVPLGGGQTLEAADLRARTDIAIYAPGVGVAVKARIDWLDNIPLGGDPDLSNGSPATSSGQRPTTVVVKRAWGEALTPFGILAAGRMGAHFGLGMTANGGDCDDCDKGDAADRVAFVSPLFGHLVAVAWELAARGSFTQSRDGGHPIGLDATDNASGLTFAVLKVHSPAALIRRAAAGRTSVEYGAYLSIRGQENDVPASYLPTATPPTMYTSDDLVARGFSATASGGWLRITRAGFRIEGELAYARARIDQPSLIPGTEITIPVTSNQLGFALQSDFAVGPARLGLDGGYASGDDAPGFGAFPKVGDAAPPPGSFDGAQANLPGDRTVDNFRFHPDYRIDQILFREIIGTVTDAIYLRPHARITLMTVGTGRLEASAALIASWAVEATSTPSGEKSLGIELDPELRYASRDGFAGALGYGVFLPGDAFDGTTLPAKPAHAVRARLWFVF